MKLFALTALAVLILPMVARADAQKPYPESSSGPSRYEVPTDDDSLKPYAMYPITDTKIVEKNEKVTIRYTLPLELTGVPNVIELTSTKTSTDGTFTRFDGPKGQANCDADSCNVRYNNLKINAKAAANVLAKEGVTGAELNARMKLIASFSGDPAGIIHFDQTKKTLK